MNEIKIGKRKIGEKHPPFVIVEIGINHEGSMAKAKQMVRDAKKAGAECVKFQSHVVEDEMVSRDSLKDLTPSHATESVWDIVQRCAFSEKQERELKKYVESLGMIYLCTPFSRAAVDRLERMKVQAYKIGSGECNNYPLIEHIASFGKPIILSTGMNTISSIKKSVSILKKHKVPYALLNCTSMYPAPYDKIRLKGITVLKQAFKDAVVGQSDHSLGVYTCLGAVALGASILEKHFTSDKKWPGPDIPVSIDPAELKELVVGSKAVWQAMGERTHILKEEQEIINFAYASVVSIKDIKKGEKFTRQNIWVKRPGTGEILAEEFEKVLRKKARVDVARNTQLRRKDMA